MKEHEEGRSILHNQTAIVTGASSGIGASIARELAKAGAQVVANYAGNKDGAVKIVRQISDAGGRARAFRADVGNEEDVRELFYAAVHEYGTVGILVSNAGIQKDSPFPDMTLEQWNAVIRINLTGAFLCAREAAMEFIRRGMIPERSRALGKNHLYQFGS